MPDVRIDAFDKSLHHARRELGTLRGPISGLCLQAAGRALSVFARARKGKAA